MGELSAKGVHTQVLYIPVHLQPWYRSTYGYGRGKCPVAEDFYRHALSLPLYPAMSDADVDRVTDAVQQLAVSDLTVSDLAARALTETGRQ
jgi:perosamine synthetase